MKLCSNRPEGFGPSSQLSSSSLPTTCFIDTMLIPLPTWLALLLLSLLFLHTLLCPSLSTSQPRTRPPTLPLTLHFLLMLSLVLMNSIIIARLSLLGWRIGLLPFTYVSVILSSGLFSTNGFRGRVRYWGVISTVIWAGGATMSFLQAAGLVQQLGWDWEERKGGRYPVGDEVVDGLVVGALWVVVGVLDGVWGVWGRRWVEGRVESRVERRAGKVDEIDQGVNNKGNLAC
ncbi:hypothetical protein CJF32_00009251 [Rutstroemia sp. NJR-2017a WRK4]|nr:hypothetical protein CJF32_00009251 [Rutstroemia sp. NJR-2017a WRK4]